MRACTDKRTVRWTVLALLILIAARGAAAAERDSAPAGNPWPGNYTRDAGNTRAKFDTSLGDPAPIPEAELVPALMNAIFQLSRYPRAVGVPEINRIPHDRLQQLVCGAPCPALATYRPGEGIYLDEKLKPETSPFDRSVLLHELVHYVQEMNDAHAALKPCSRWYYREQEAYAIQKTFLIAVGSPVRVGYSAHASTCDDETAKANANVDHRNAEDAK
jgi:hypothetical protein